MGIVDSIKGAVTNFYDPDDPTNLTVLGAFGDQLQKAEIKAYTMASDPRPLPDYDLTFYLNPASLTVTKVALFDQPENSGNQSEAVWKGTKPLELTIGQLWFDTFEEKKSVRKYIDTLESLVEYDKDLHHPPVVQLHWGSFTEDTKFQESYYFYVDSLTVKYTMFLPNGTPVRAEVSLKLKQVNPVSKQAESNPKQSPDHAKLYTVRRGDTLQAIAEKEYDDPREWRRIADTNGISNPMNLRPGTKLLVPPILS